VPPSGPGSANVSGTSAGQTSRRLPFLRFESRRGRQAELIASLNDVASAVSSTLSVEDVLYTIVDRAKRITNTEKAILLLTQDESQRLDFDTLVVRGRLDQHPQEWWEEHVIASAPEAFANGMAMVEADQPNDAWIVYSPIRVQSRPIGLLCAINSRSHRFSNEQVEFLAILSAFAASAIENARLAEETRYVLLASERDRIAREMHDGISQSLFSISLGLELCKKLIARGEDAAVLSRLNELQVHLNDSMAELRRFIYDLRPMKLQELGVAGALDYWIREVTAGRTVRGSLDIEGTPYPISPETEACLYRVAKEATSNVVRHAGARQFHVRLVYLPGSLELSVSDDGKGFDAEAVVDSGLPGSGMGLRSIRERVKREGGQLSVSSSAEAGTTIEVRLPVGDES
jgi:signal transduction histidine kinase